MSDTQRRPGAKEPDRSAISALPSWYVLIGVTIIVVVGIGVWLLLAPVAGSDPRLLIDVGKTALTAAGGAGALFGLWLAFRRQQSTESFNRHEMHDAAERRITELYTKAADQLGSERAAVRLAGIYAFERLAQANCSQRQTIIDVLCAYLRMPFRLDGYELEVDSLEFAEWLQEKDVRRTIVHILGKPRKWAHYGAEATYPTLNLSGAVLENFSLGSTEVNLMIPHARLIGSTSFHGTRFHLLDMNGAIIRGSLNLDRANIPEMSVMTGARIEGRLSIVRPERLHAGAEWHEWFQFERNIRSLEVADSGSATDDNGEGPPHLRPTSVPDSR